MLNKFSIIEWTWLTIGFIGQLCFGARFLVQWLRSEQLRKSVIPVSFWYFSIIGSLILLVYAIHLREPVFISGQLFGTVVYVRNLLLIAQEKKMLATPLSTPQSST